jgi:hypothetical protein
MIVKGSRKELKAIADFMQNLPPKSWQEIWNSLDPLVVTNMKAAWIATGKSLDAYFSDQPNPIYDLNISEAYKAYIQRETSFYATLTLVMFEAEKFIRQEASKLGMDFVKNWSRKDFVKNWMIEDCAESIWLYSQEFWESQSPKKVNDRLKDLGKISNGELSNERAKILYSRWDSEDSKLCRPEKHIQKPWTSFCNNVFGLYRKDIPSLVALEALIFKPIPDKIFTAKFAINNGQKTVYPGRGKGKKSS